MTDKPTIGARTKNPRPRVPSAKGGTHQLRGVHQKLNDDVIAKVEQAVGFGVPLTYAAAHAGVSYAAMQSWIAEAETGFTRHAKRKLKPEEHRLRLDLVAAIERAKSKFVVNNSANITRHATNDWKASAWMLSHSPDTREQYSEAGRVRIEVEKRLSLAIEVLQRELPPATFERVLMGISETAMEFGGS